MSLAIYSWLLKEDLVECSSTYQAISGAGDAAMQDSTPTNRSFEQS